MNIEEAKDKAAQYLGYNDYYHVNWSDTYKAKEVLEKALEMVISSKDTELADLKDRNEELNGISNDAIKLLETVNKDLKIYKDLAYKQKEELEQAKKYLDEVQVAATKHADYLHSRINEQSKEIEELKKERDEEINYENNQHENLVHYRNKCKSLQSELDKLKEENGQLLLSFNRFLFDNGFVVDGKIQYSELLKYIEVFNSTK